MHHEIGGKGSLPFIILPGAFAMSVLVKPLEVLVIVTIALRLLAEVLGDVAEQAVVVLPGVLGGP